MVPREPDFNPYAAPQADLGRDDLTDFHRIVNTRLTYSECWRIAAEPATFLLLTFLKTLRIPFRLKTAVPYLRSIDRVPTDQIPPHVLSRWRGLLDECEALGLRLLLCYQAPSIGITKENLAAVFLSEDDLTQVTIIYTRFEYGMTVREKVTIVAGSSLEGARRAVTRNSRSYLNMPPDSIVQVVRCRTVGELLGRHRDWLASRGWAPLPSSPHELERRILEREQALVEFQVGRGVMAPMTRREVEHFIRKTAGGVDPSRVNARVLRVLGIAQGWLCLAVLAVTVYNFSARPRTLAQIRLHLTLNRVGDACLLALFAIVAVRVYLVRSTRRGA
jgi:hypothetical protein